MQQQIQANESGFQAAPLPVIYISVVTYANADGILL